MQKMTNKQYLLCLPTMGFNDVLSQLARAWMYAEIHNRTLVLDTRHSPFQDSFARYFSTATKNVLLHPGEALLRHFDTLSTWPPDLRGRPYDALKIPYGGHNRYSLTMDLLRPYQEDLLVHRSTHGDDLGHIALRKLRLIPEVALEIARSLVVLGEDYDAVHIRNTDIGTDYCFFFARYSPWCGGGSSWSARMMQLAGKRRRSFLWNHMW